MASLTVLSGRTTANGKPSGATAGVKLWKTSTIGDGLFRGQNRATLRTSAPVTTSTVGSYDLIMWGYDGTEWAPLGTSATVANKGMVNEENTLEETDTDKIQHTELIKGLSGLQRVYAQVLNPTNIAAGGIDVELNAPASPASFEA